MRLTKRDANLVLAIVSLLLAAGFFTMYYTPKMEAYEERASQVAVIEEWIRTAGAALREIPAHTDYEPLYREKLDELSLIAPEETNALMAASAVESLARETRVHIIHLSRPSEDRLSVRISGEYRALMMFLFQLQHTAQSTSIQGFSLSLATPSPQPQGQPQEDPSAPPLQTPPTTSALAEVRFPVQAEFTIVLPQHGGE